MIYWLFYSFSGATQNSIKVAQVDSFAFFLHFLWVISNHC